jgi:hypothetical protein
VSVHLYVEGGGSQHSTKAACRKAFRLLIDKTIGDLPKPRIVACGSRTEAYKDFCRSLQNEPDVYAFLLVDSEGPVAAGSKRVEHLRAKDGWRPDLLEDQVHLMVQCMESWFLADKRAVAAYYRHGFDERALPPNQHVEQVPGHDLMRGFQMATKNTAKGSYHKTKDGFALLALIDPARLRTQSAHADAFFTALIGRLS